MEVNPCAGCGEVRTRREFMRDAALAVSGILAGLGVGQDAAALTVREVPGVRAGAMVSYAIPAGDGALIDKENEVILVRWSGAVYAFSLSCPHQRTALRWDGDDSIFRCPKHKSQFKPEGTLIEGKAKRGMDRYRLTRAGDTVTVDTTAAIKQSDDAAAWTAAMIKL